jgi:hypothetical protein
MTTIYATEVTGPGHATSDMEITRDDLYIIWELSTGKTLTVQICIILDLSLKCKHFL